MKTSMTRLVNLGPLGLEAEVTFDFFYWPGRPATYWAPEDPPEGEIDFGSIKRLDGLLMHDGVETAVEALDWDSLMEEASERYDDQFIDPTEG